MSMSIALLILFLVFMFLGVPIAVSLGAASVICMVTMSDLPLSMAGTVNVYINEQFYHGCSSAVYSLRFVNG